MSASQAPVVAAPSLGNEARSAFRTPFLEPFAPPVRVNPILGVCCDFEG